MPKVILTINCGSSSLKFQVYDWDNKNRLAVGLVERIELGHAVMKYRAHMECIIGSGHCPAAKEAVELMYQYITN